MGDKCFECYLLNGSITDDGAYGLCVYYQELVYDPDYAKYCDHFCDDDKYLYTSEMK